MKLNIALMLLAMTSTLNVQANISHRQQAETKFIISSYAKPNTRLSLHMHSSALIA